MLSPQERPAYLLRDNDYGIGQKLAAGLAQPRPNRISLEGDKFTLIMASGQHHPQVPVQMSIQAIFVGGNPHTSRTYYDSDTYDRASPDAPVCFSDNGVAPSEKSQTPQSPTCGQCEKAKWGSALSKMTGKGIPACQSRKKAAVMVAGAGEDVFLLDIPPGSLKSFGRYMERIGVELHANPQDVITQISMDNGKELQFEDIAWVPEALIPTVNKVIEGDEPDLVVNAHDRPIQPRIAVSTAGLAQQATIEAQREPSWNDAAPPKQPMTATEARERTLPGFAPPNGADKPKATRGRPRTPQQPPAPPAAAAANFAQPQAQTFVQPQAQQFIQPQQQQPANFGLQQPQPASAQLNDMLAKAFGATRN